MNLDRYIRNRRGGSRRGEALVVRTMPSDGIVQLMVAGTGACTRLVAQDQRESVAVGGAATLAALAVAIGRALPSEHRRAIIEHLGGVKPGREKQG